MNASAILGMGALGALFVCVTLIHLPDHDMGASMAFLTFIAGVLAGAVTRWNERS